MPTWAIILIIVGAVIVLAVAASMAWAAARRKRLRERFGPEYDRSVRTEGSQWRAEQELAGRERRRSKLIIKPLGAEARERYASEWRAVQARFVDDPTEAVRQSDALVSRTMAEMGYPMEEFGQREADISVDHPQVTENYRAAHAISLASDQGAATTEDLRQAMVHYRALFEELIGQGADTESPSTRPSPQLKEMPRVEETG